MALHLESVNLTMLLPVKSKFIASEDVMKNDNFIAIRGGRVGGVSARCLGGLAIESHPSILPLLLP